MQTTTTTTTCLLHRGKILISDIIVKSASNHLVLDRMEMTIEATKSNFFLYQATLDDVDSEDQTRATRKTVPPEALLPPPPPSPFKQLDFFFSDINI